MSTSPRDVYTAFVRDRDTHETALLVSKRMVLRDASREPEGTPARVARSTRRSHTARYLAEFLSERRAAGA